jgi:sporulation protein YlmC with PRC-barrel domain
LVAFDDATDPNLGPRQLINELVATIDFEEVMAVGKIVVIRRRTVKGW